MGMRIAGACCLLLLAGCGGGGADGAGYCVGSFQGGSTNWHCVSCSGLDPLDDAEDFQAAIDNNAKTFKGFQIDSGGLEVTVTASAPEGMTFPAGVDAGVLMRFPAGIHGSIGLSLTPLRNGVPVGPPSLQHISAAGNVPGAGSPHYYVTTPLVPFDGLQAVLTVSGNPAPVSFRLHEFCGDR